MFYIEHVRELCSIESITQVAPLGNFINKAYSNEFIYDFSSSLFAVHCSSVLQKQPKTQIMVSPANDTKVIVQALGKYAETSDREFFFLVADENGYIGTFRTQGYSQIIQLLGKGEFRFFLFNLLALILAALGKQGDQDIN